MLKPPDRFASSAQVWRDHDGSIAAYGYVDGPGNTMILPNLGTFRFGPIRGQPVHATVCSSIDRETVQDAYRRMVVPMVLQVRGLEVLHSSAVLAGGVVVAFCGVSQSGKSTMSYAFARRGNLLWADDSVAFDASRDPIMAKPLPFGTRFRQASLEYFLGRGEASEVGAARKVATRGLGEARLGVLFVLAGRGDASTVQVRRLAPAEAFPTILVHAYCFSLQDSSRKRATAENYLRLVHAVPVFEVRLPTGFEHLDQSLNRLVAVYEEVRAEAGGRGSTW